MPSWAMSLSAAQTYCSCVFGLYADGFQSAPPCALGANAAGCLSSYGAQMHPILTRKPDILACLPLNAALCAHCSENGWPTGTGCVGHVLFDFICGTLTSLIPTSGVPFVRSSR